MKQESNIFDKKSIKTITGKTADFNELAKDCVAFANTNGGHLHIGIEDSEELPPKDQKISTDLAEKTIKRLNELTTNVGLHQEIILAENGGQFLDITIHRSASSVACTTKGIYYMRDNDSSKPLLPDELSRLLNDKPSYCWETKVSMKVEWQNCDSAKLSGFVSDIRNSQRVSQFVKEKVTLELLEHYLMVDENGFLTNLGVLWVGKREHRARLLYSPIIQYIKYNYNEEKVQKLLWDDYSLNPKELLEAVWTSIPDWKEFDELSDGLWRKNIPAYDEKLVREALCNALVHRPYTTRGDIFINIFPEYATIVNPGCLPFGITSTNILHKTVQRNVHLSKVFYDLGLMEKEGSGFDLMYSIQLAAGKKVPLVKEGDDFVELTIYRKIIDKHVSRLYEYANNQFQLSQKNLTALCLILQKKSITPSELSSVLQLPEQERLRGYIKTLIDKEIIISHGKRKGTKYLVNPKLIANARLNVVTTLKTIEPYRLEALVLEDLKYHPDSLFDDICGRLPDVDRNELRRLVYKMAKNGKIHHNVGRKFRKYRLIDD